MTTVYLPVEVDDQGKFDSLAVLFRRGVVPRLIQCAVNPQDSFRNADKSIAVRLVLEGPHPGEDFEAQVAPWFIVHGDGKLTIERNDLDFLLKCAIHARNAIKDDVSRFAKVVDAADVNSAVGRKFESIVSELQQDYERTWSVFRKMVKMMESEP